MKTIVIDASVILGFLLKSNSEAVKKFPLLLRQAKINKLRLLSLTMMTFEVANGLRFSETNQINAGLILKQFFSLPIKMVNLSLELIGKSLDFSYKNKVTVYDAAYHFLAVSRNKTLLTGDKKYYQAAKQLKHIEYLG